MRILLISSRYLPHRGGLESVVHHLAREYVGLGHTVRIVTNRYPRTLPASEVIEGVPVTRLHFLLPGARYLHARRFDLWLASFWYRYSSARALGRIIRAFRPSIINNHYLNEVAEFTGRCLARRLPLIPWVISLHGGDVDGEPHLSAANKARFRRLSLAADGLTACSGFLAAQAIELEPALAGKITAIHNGVDVQRFAAAPPYPSDGPYILAVGQLLSHKGFDILIHAFSQVALRYPGVQLLIAGEGPERTVLEAAIQQGRLESRIKLLGKVDEARVASLMAGCLFVAMPSRREPFGIVALEGMAAGKPVLAAPVGGLPEFMPVPPNRLVPVNLADWIAALDEWLALCEQGLLDAAVNLQEAAGHDWLDVAQSYLQVYNQVITNI